MTNKINNLENKKEEKNISSTLVQISGKQYFVKENELIAVDKLDGNRGDKITLDQILVYKGEVGTPLVKGKKIEAEIVAQQKDEKIIVFKKKRRHNYRRKIGHRQEMTVLKINKI